MVSSDWDLALTCICGPNFRSNSSENSPDFGPEYVCFPNNNKNHKRIWFHTNRVYNKDFECKKMRRRQDFF